MNTLLRTSLTIVCSTCLFANWAFTQDEYTTVVLADEPIALYSFVSGPGAQTIIDITGNGHDSKSMMGNVQIVSGGIVGDAALFSLDLNTNTGGSIVVDLQMNPLDPEGDGIGVGLGDFTLEALVSPLEVGRGASVSGAEGWNWARTIERTDYCKRIVGLVHGWEYIELGNPASRRRVVPLRVLVRWRWGR